MVWLSRALTKGLLHGARSRHEAKTNLGKLVESQCLALKRFLPPNSAVYSKRLVRTVLSKAGTHTEPYLSNLASLIVFQVSVIQSECVGGSRHR